jgi:hypothetical protein
MSNEDSDLIAKLKEAITRSPDSGGTTKQWDRWFDVSTLDRDLRRKLSFHDLRRLGAHAVSAFAPEQESSAEGRDGTTASSPLQPTSSDVERLEAVLRHLVAGVEHELRCGTKLLVSTVSTAEAGRALLSLSSRERETCGAAALPAQHTAPAALRVLDALGDGVLADAERLSDCRPADLAEAIMDRIRAMEAAARSEHQSAGRDSVLEDCIKVLLRGIGHSHRHGRTCCAQTLSNEIDNIRSLKQEGGR